MNFFSFLRRSIPLIEIYNMSYFNIYHMARYVCVLEVFNCMLLRGWTLNLGVGPLVLCT